MTEETTEMGASTTTTAKPKRKASAAKAGAPKAAKKARASKQTTGDKKAPKAAKKAKAPKTPKAPKSAAHRAGTKTDKVIEMLKRPGGATADELLKETGWQAHSLRGFISGTLKKKMGVEVTSAKNDAGERTYTIAGAA